MKLQIKIFLLFIAVALLLGGPLLWIVQKSARAIDLDDVAQEGQLKVLDLADRIAPVFPAAHETSLLPFLQSAQEQTGALYVTAIGLDGRILAHTNVAETGRIYNDANTVADLHLEKPDRHTSFYLGTLTMEVAAPVWSVGASASPEDFLLSGTKVHSQKDHLGVVRLGLPLDQVSQRERKLFHEITLTVSIMGGIGIALVFFFLQRLLRPIRWLSSGAARIAKGEYGVSSPVLSHDELGNLTQNFNHMSRVLAETTVSKKDLEASQQELIKAQRLAHIGSYQSSPDRSRVYWSEEVYRIFRRDPKLPPPTAEEQQGLFTPESWAQFLESRAEALRSGKSYEIDLEIICLDGAEHWITLRGETIYDSDGRAVGIRGTAQDITERKRAQDELAQSRQMLQTILDSIPQRVFWKDRNIVYLGCNRSFAADAGLRDPAEVVGKTDFDLEWKKMAELYRRDDKKVMDQDSPKLNFEEPQERLDGAKLWLQTSKLPLHDAEGHVTGIVGAYEDITERKRIAEQMILISTALEQATETVVITDRDGTILYVNPAFSRISGYPQAEVIGKNPRILKSGQHGPDYYADMWETLTKGEMWEGILINRRKDGTLYEEDATINPVMNSQGDITHFVAVKRDVTQRRKLEEMLRQQDKMSAVGQLAAGVAHEINNPLGVILGFAQASLRHVSPGEMLEKPLQSIEREALRCKNLVQDLLTFSRVSKIGREPLDFNKVIESALSLVTARANTSHVEVRRELAVELPHLLGNPNQLQQVIVNLANNAFDAMGEKGGRLTVKTEILSGGPLSWICLKVTDTGSGIPLEVLPKVFEPFFTTKPVGKGTGLGLSLIHEIVKKHSGMIEVKSQPGHTEFTIKLPVRVGQGKRAAA